MNQLPLLTSACRSCRHFTPEGRRGGTCQQLGVPVQASWKSCSLAVPAFASNWDSVKKLELWGTTILPEVIPIAEMKESSLAEANVLEALSA